MALNLKLFTTNFKLQTFNSDYEPRTTNLPKKFCLKEETFRQNFFFRHYVVTACGNVVKCGEK